ncbi:F25B4.6 [Symbiodinium sp. CCMP2592]|nr:F25B4.6 [Symbiodinium sp. CCMP2592]
MASTMLESEAEFTARAQAINMEAAFLEALRNVGIKTFGHLAYICAVNPQSGDDTGLIQAVEDLIKRKLDPTEIPDLRRLWYEANTFAISDLKQRVERSSLDPPRELPLAERMTRLQNQKKRLQGVVFTERVEPSHGLIDKIQSMIDSGALVYLPPHKCPSRALEISADRPGQQVQLNVLSFAVHEGWHTHMFDAITRDPPPGHKFTSIAQALNADRELWQLIAQESRGELKVVAGADPPLDKFMAALSTHTRVNICLANLPKGSGKGPENKPDHTGQEAKGGRGRGGKGAKGDKGNKRKWDDSVDPKRAEILQLLKEMPKGCVSRMPKTRQFLCVLFQHGKCPQQSKDRCNRGLHNCWHKDCLRKGVPYCPPGPPTTDVAPYAVFVELCCGSAILSHAAASQGWQVYPIDHHSNRFESLVSFLPLDLSTLSSRKLVDDLIHHVRPLWIHFGLPCGTSSRARQLPVSPKLRAKGVPAPRPLRSARFPLGLPDLSPLERQRVESANAVYVTCVHALFAAWKANALITIENPSRAWTWAALAQLVTRFGRDHGCPDFVDWFFQLEDVHFSMCMHGGQRKKDTRLRSSPGAFSSLAMECDGLHDHAPYGHQWSGGKWNFDTASEAQYPRLLCKRLVSAATAAVSPALLDTTRLHFRLDSLAAVGAQTVKHQPLIPEFKSIVWGADRPNQPCKPLPEVPSSQCDNCHAAPGWPVPLSLDISLETPLSAEPAEKLAWTMLQDRLASQDQVLQMVSLLSQSPSSRRAKLHAGLAWMTGAYVFGPQAGLHGASSSMPSVSCVLAPLARHFAPQAAFSALAVFSDFYSPRHVDQHNDHSFMNVVIPLSCFQQGGIAVNDTILPVSEGPCFLQSAMPHEVLPALGKRVTLVAYVTRAWQGLSPAQCQTLRSLGFLLPSDCPSPSNTAGEHEAGRLVHSQPGGPKACAWGIYHSMEEHVQKASNLNHSVDSTGSVPDNIRRAIFDIATLGPTFIRELREKEIVSIEKRAAELGSDNKHPITKDKCLSLFRELVTETQFPDPEVCTFMEEGVPLVGIEPSSPLFPPRPRPTKATPEQLDSQAVWRRRELLSKPPQALADDELEILNAETKEECRLGFLEGPFFDEAAVAERLGSEEWSPSQRFLLLQGEERKPRVIDNLRDSGINASFGSTSHLHLHDIDFVTALTMLIADVWNCKDEVRVPLSTGEVLTGHWHPDSLRAEWTGRCFDLSKAYKQVPVLESSLKYAVIAMPDRKRKWVFYLARGLPFGGSGSVFAFNRVSRAIWHVAVEKLRMVTSVFVDDFPTLEIGPLTQSATSVFSRLLTALGWVHATTGKKAIDFTSTWVALGAKFDVSKLHEGRLEISNKEGRVDRIRGMAGAMLDEGADLRQLATSLHGLLNFASGFTLGSSLKPIARICSRISARPSSFGAEALKQMNDLLAATLSSLRPRTITVSDPRKPVIVYTDGSYEDEVAKWGSFFVDLESGEKFVLAGVVPEELRKMWHTQVGEQIICEVELFAVVCAKWVYGKRMSARKAFIFIDNNSALATLIKRSSQSEAMFRLMALVNVMDSVHPVGAWYHRVPSKSNPADLPSRDESSELCRIFNATDQGEFTPPEEMVRFIMEPSFCVASLESAVAAYTKHQP